MKIIKNSSFFLLFLSTYIAIGSEPFNPASIWGELANNEKPLDALTMPDGSEIMTGQGIKRFYQEPAFAIYKRLHGVAVSDFGNVDETLKTKNPFEQFGKAYIPVETRQTYTSAIAQLQDGSFVATGPYEKNRVIIGKWNSSGKPDTNFGTGAKTIVQFHENVIVPGTELSSPKVIAERDNGDIIVFGSFAQGAQTLPFTITLDKNGSVKEKSLIKETSPQQASAPARQDAPKYERKPDILTKEQYLERENRMNTYPTTGSTPGMISESERLMNTYPTPTK